MNSRVFRALRACIAAAALVLAAAPPLPAAAPAPTTAPAATQPSKAMRPTELERRGRYYKTAWAGNNIRSQSMADQQLVTGILQAKPADAAGLREQMVKEYQRLADLPERDEFRCALLASRIALTWTRVDESKELSAAELAINKKNMCEGVTEWGMRSLVHFGGEIAEKHRTRFKAFVSGTAVSMLSLIQSRMPWSSRLGAARQKLLDLRPHLEKLAEIDPLTEGQVKQQLADFYRTLEPLGKLAADKQAIRALLVGFEKAYNARDDKAFIALWPDADHPRVRSLKTRSLARKIPETHWKIVRWEPAYIIVKADKANAYVVSQYQTEDGMNHPLTLQPFPAKKTKDVTWKLN